jgi:hypothetical protein
MNTRPGARLRQRVKRELLDLANVQRLHIVGCSRSGTTMLHYLMSAFEDSLLIDEETALWNTPDIGFVLRLLLARMKGQRETLLVSKRNSSWHRPENIAGLARYVRESNVFVVYVVRDPRDVLTSRHVLDDRKHYVDFGFWRRSIEAGLELQELLGSYPHFLVIRYEDVVCSAAAVESVLHARFGLRKRAGVSSIANLKDNLENLGLAGGQMIAYMHDLRNLDPASIGRWKNDEARCERVAELFEDDARREFLQHFGETYGYSFS